LEDILLKSDPSLAGRVVLITGGSRGLGREMAYALAEAGSMLCITGSSESEALDETANSIGKLTDRNNILKVIANVSDDDDVQKTVSCCIDHFGRIDVLINNAGRGMRLVSETFNSKPTKFWQCEPDDWRKIVDINANGPFLMARNVVPHMLERKFGKIVNISTSDQTMVRTGYSPYGPSKALLEAASRVWAQDLAGTGIDVNVLLPGGAADTDLLPPSPDKKGADGNLLSPAVMRDPILWLASDQSNGRTGERYIGRLWDGPDAARDASIDRPKIM
jgi:NAD(P)-dependent dehydrogenase (short-subunit alcohol dehydrogenase family)